LESVDPFFVDSGIARLHKALGVLRLGGVTPLRETPIGSLIEAHIGDLLGILLSPSFSSSPSSSPPPPVYAVGTSVYKSGSVLLVRSKLIKNINIPACAIVVSKDSVSCHHIHGTECTTTAATSNDINMQRQKERYKIQSKFKVKKKSSPIVCMTLMHDEKILIIANEKQQINILDIPTLVSRGKVITGGDDDITSLAAHGETLAIGCASGLIRVLTIVGGEYLNRETNLPVRFESMLTGHSSKVMTLDLEMDGQLISGML
jgi:WD40 repeat protein